MKKNKKIQLLIVTIVLFTILTSSIKLTFDGYNEFYKDSINTKEKGVVKVFDAVYNFHPIKLFRSYTGLETGYGFFGPNVSSDFILLYEVYNDKGKLVGQNNFELSSKEGCLRFMSLNRLFLEKISNKNNPKYNKYIEIILGKISQFIAKDFPENYTIKSYVYLYDFPSISDFNKGREAKLYLIKTNQWKK